MSLTNMPASQRVHIGFFGKTNAGKSSVINAITAQNLSIVSDIKGTTTDPVVKTMEILPLGPVVIIDTPGINDDSQLGALRIEKALKILGKTDIAVLVIDANIGMTLDDEKLIDLIKSRKIPYIICYNKSDIKKCVVNNKNEICVSANSNENIHELKELIAKQIDFKNDKKIVCDLIDKDDVVVLVIPVDEGAPKGRLILPQQQVIRELLENGNICICAKETELSSVIEKFGDKIKLIITDSQAFKYVAEVTPDDIPLTSFSILFLRYKGELNIALDSLATLEKLKDGDNVLICEGCTHHRQCNDIGTIKIPNWITDYTKVNLNFEFSSGTEFPSNLDKYSLIIHCGGCMLNEKEMKYRMEIASNANIPMTNYGMFIAYINGIIKRAIKPLNINL